MSIAIATTTTTAAATATAGDWRFRACDDAMAPDCLPQWWIWQHGPVMDLATQRSNLSAAVSGAKEEPAAAPADGFWCWRWLSWCGVVGILKRSAVKDSTGAVHLFPTNYRQPAWNSVKVQPISTLRLPDHARPAAELPNRRNYLHYFRKSMYLLPPKLVGKRCI